ncbi:MAG: stage II sporulation protein P [Clostridiales bacterium]|nr:stage II sporulation protein P [Clostridiales bacterium]
MRKLIIWLVLLMMPLAAWADEPVWTIVDEDGTRLTQICYEPEAGDEYISGDDRLYEIIRTQEGVAVAKDKGNIDLPDVSWLNADAALPVVALGDKLIALYCTHSDESYEPSDGKYSDEERGSIYQVADALAEALEENGAETEVSDALHHPHDAGAYRRSRQTAVQLLKAMPDALLDIHRDGIPDPDEYATTIGGKDCSKVRLLVGRGNQNMDVNKEFALKIKAVADKVYPGLIKDIYMGKGTYNQDLAPHSVLLECGTYTLSKERVLASMPMMSDVIYRTMYGGVTGSAGTSDVRGTGTRMNDAARDDEEPAAESSSGMGSGILWIVGIAVAAFIIFAIVSTGSIKDGMRKAGRNLSEMTGGLIGKKPKDGEDHNHS